MFSIGLDFSVSFDGYGACPNHLIRFVFVLDLVIIVKILLLSVFVQYFLDNHLMDFLGPFAKLIIGDA